MNEKLKCEFCGAEKEEFTFIIGASPKPDWCMIEGTGKITCPECYKIASKEGSDKIDNYIKNHNARVKADNLKEVLK
jgi:hypothetical protein